MSADTDISGLHAFSFGNSPEMADALLAVVLEGRKTATCAAWEAYKAGGEPVPHAGERFVVLDGAGKPRAVIETVKIEFLPFEAVPLEYAVNAGEGWTTVEEWRDAYSGYLRRNSGFEPGMVMMCERFRLVEVLESDGTEKT